jgi:hypothetical protein
MNDHFLTGQYMYKKQQCRTFFSPSLLSFLALYIDAHSPDPQRPCLYPRGFLLYHHCPLRHLVQLPIRENPVLNDHQPHPHAAMSPDSDVYRRPSRRRLASSYLHTPARPTHPPEQPTAPVATEPQPELTQGGTVRDWILGLYFLSPLCRWLQPALYARAWEYKRVLEERRRNATREEHSNGPTT